MEMDERTKNILKKQDLRYLRYWKIIVYGCPIIFIFLIFGGGSYKFGIEFLWKSYMDFFNFPALPFFIIVMLIWIVVARIGFKKAEKEIEIHWESKK